MKKQLYFILIPAFFTNALSVAESFKSREFDNLGEIPEAVNKELQQEDESEEDEQVLVMSLSTFTEFYNDNEGSQYFIAPVYVV